MVEVTKITETSFKWSHAGTATLIAPNTAAGHHRPTPPPETPGHSQANLGWSLGGVTSPFAWVLCMEGFVCALKESVSPVLCKFCNQIPLASNVKLPGGSQSLCQIPRLVNPLWFLGHT